MPDIRNTKVVDIVRELREFGIDPLVFDPRADPHHAREELGIGLRPLTELTGLHALVLAVPHRELMELPKRELFGMLAPDGILIDVKSVFSPADVPEGIRYWSL